MDRTAAVVLPNAFSAFGTFLMTQFIKGISDEFTEAALIDGANTAKTFLHIIVPLTKPAVSALAILLFIESWTMVEQPLIFLTDAALFPLSLYLGSLSAQLYAGGFIFLIFPVLIYLLGYEDLTNGIAISGLR
jgi:multiple sugar transport system permease protein